MDVVGEQARPEPNADAATGALTPRPPPPPPHTLTPSLLRGCGGWGVGEWVWAAVRADPAPPLDRSRNRVPIPPECVWHAVVGPFPHSNVTGPGTEGLV